MQNFIITKNKIMDNVQFFKENSENDYVECIQSLIASKPFEEHKFYIFSFVKRVDDVAGIKKMYHQPRLTKPEPIPGSTLIRVDPKDPETALILWTLPNQENFNLYKYNKLFGDRFVDECVEKFKTNPMAMCEPEPDDLTEDQIRDIYECKKRKAS